MSAPYPDEPEDDDLPPDFTWWAVVMGLGLTFYAAVFFGGRAAGWW